MCQVGWTHAPLFITGNRGGVSSVEKGIMTLICLSSVNWQVLKIPTTLTDKLNQFMQKYMSKNGPTHLLDWHEKCENP